MVVNFNLSGNNLSNFKNLKLEKTKSNGYRNMTNFALLQTLKTDSIAFTGNANNQNSVISFDVLANNIDKFDKDMMNVETYKLAQMAAKGVPVVPGFVISGQTSSNISNDLMDKINFSIKEVEQKTSKKLGDNTSPLILSIQNGPLTTYVGFNKTTVNALLDKMEKNEENSKFVYDSYRHAISSFGTNVFGIAPEEFSKALDDIKTRKNISSTDKLTSTILKDEVVPKFKEIISRQTGKNFPESTEEQLKLAVAAKSKCSHKHPIIVSAKSFSNTSTNSIIGVYGTRNPETGENEIIGDYLQNSTGMELMSGGAKLNNINELDTTMPQIYNDLNQYAKQIEGIFHRPQNIDFVVEDGKLQILSTHNLDETPLARIKTSVDMNEEGLMTDRQALSRVNCDLLENSLTTNFKPESASKARTEGRFLAQGVGASDGATSGKIVFNTQKAKELINSGEKVVLVKGDTNAEDVEVMVNNNTNGIIAINAGSSSHAAVIARGISKPCIVSCPKIKINSNNTASIDDKTVKEGDLISIDGATGEIFKGKVETTTVNPPVEFYKILDLADKNATIQVLANADTPADADKAKQLGAKGIGLCRTEHMFFGDDRTSVMQKVILADSDDERRQGLNQLEQMQYRDFCQMFRTMEDSRITVRLLDPPLNEFLPKSREILSEIADIEKDIEKNPIPTFTKMYNKIRNNDGQEKNLEEKKQLLARIDDLTESNPMMGRRGSRLGIVVPELYNMQVKAIVKAALATNAKPEIMLPMISDEKELETLIKSLKNVVKQVLTEEYGSGNSEIDKRLKEFKFGTMIELPRAALIADDLAKSADFFSFGTNDLTQMTYGMSRDDAQKGFLMKYMETGILDNNPFEKLDPKGVGKLVKMAAQAGKEVKPDMHIGVCGEQGRDPESIRFLAKTGNIDYVSVSPSGIPVARLATGKEGVKRKASFGANIFTPIASLFTRNVNPTSSDSFSALKNILDQEFSDSMNRVSRNGTMTDDEVKEELRKEYGQETADVLNISGNKVGFNNLVVLIPGINKNGSVPDLFPVIDSGNYRGYMGGGHWHTESHLLDTLIPKIKREFPNFSFQQLRKDLNMEDIDGNNALPDGVSLPTKGNSHILMANISNTTDAIDDGKANYASIHGFAVYDGQNNNYIVLDNKPGIKEFVQKNKKLFNNMSQRFNLKGIIVGGDNVMNADKERNDRVNQMRGELTMAGVETTEFPDNNNSKQLNTPDLIKLLTNTASNKRYLKSLND